MISSGWTLRDLAFELEAAAVVVTTAGLGTLNHTALTLEALDGIDLAGLVIGSWPTRPGIVEWCNVGDLYRMSPRQFAGALPAGLAGVKDFAGRARAALNADLGGTWDAQEFRRHADEQELTWRRSSS